MDRYSIEFRPAAYRAFGKLDPAVKRRLSLAIEALRDDPRPPGVRHLAGPTDLWRIRVGSYRIIYTVEDERLIVFVVKLGHRRDVYRDR